MINLEPGEVIQFKVKKHWWKMFVWGFYLFVLSLIPIIIAGALLFFRKEVSDLKFINIFGFFYSMWLAILWVLFFIEWTDYRLDMWIVTNHRIVDVDQAGFFARDIATVELADIEDITIEMYGLLSTFFKFGTMTLQTAGSTNEFYIKYASNPEEVKGLIYSLVHNIKKHKHQDNP